MMNLWPLLLVVFLWYFTENTPVFSAFRDETTYDVCSLEPIQVDARLKYQFSGKCQFVPRITRPDIEVKINWNGQGGYNPESGRVNEVIVLNGVAPYKGKVDSTMICNSDPWLGSAICFNVKSSLQGEVASLNLAYINQIVPQVMNRKNPFTTGYQYDRGRLLVQRDAALKALAAQAEEEARAKAQTELNARNSRLLKGARKQPLIVPTILAPAVNALFLANTSVSIKIAPPQGMSVTSYMVRLERSTAQGSWMLVTNLPIGAAEASSPSGYLGWGAPGNGRGAAMIAGPGTYRISAQVTGPHQTVWSSPIEFVVTAPNKAIKKAPKMFGQ